MSPEIHPIVEGLRPNPEQRPAVVARGRDVVVTAGAGTGKTRTLVARYLALLAQGRESTRRGSAQVRRVVAITFTRKAAREMRNRIRAEVQGYLRGADLSAQDRDYWQEVYGGLDAARIGTIHSLCTEILRAHPAEADIDPRFQVLEEGQAGLVLGEVLDAALTWAADDPDTATLFTLLGGARGLRQVLEALLRQRLDAVAAFEAIDDEPLVGWRRVMEQRQRVRLDEMLADEAFGEAVDALRESEPTDAEDAMALQRRWALKAIDDAVGTGGGGEPAHGDRVAALSRLDQINLGGGSYKAWCGGKEELVAVKEALRTLRGLWRKHADFLLLELNPRDERLAEGMPALKAVFDFTCQRYRAAKERERACDFDDLEERALAVLRDCAGVRARWLREVDAILVDEFQDTNRRQRDLMRLLGASDAVTPVLAPGRLFIVGDAKQSIYGFRGADVTVFRSEREAIVEEGGKGVVLRTSYRAHRGLVEALNDLLRPVLGEAEDPERPWIEPFAPIAPHREEPARGIEAPYVEFHLTVGSKTDGALDRAARALVGRVGEIVDGSTQSSEEGARPLSYGDVAILCRASTSFSAYEDALDEAGLPYVTVAGRGFYDRPEIRDLLNALRAVSDPTDDLALVGLLRSPAVALSDGAIYRLVGAREEESVPLWDTLRRGGGDLDSVAEARAARAVSLVRDLHAMAGRMTVGDLLKTFLDATGYRAALLKGGQQRAVRNVDKLLSDAQASGLVRVGAFLEYIEGLRDSGAREGEARAVAGGAVQIMSVHQAKGLEFPVVVLGDATWGGGGRGGGVLMDPALGVLLPLKDPEDDETAAVYRLAQARDADRGAAESDRLLYVAATRAREKLLVSACLGGIKKDGTPHKLGGWLAKLGRPLGLQEIEIPYDDQGSQVHRRQLYSGETIVDCRVYEPACTWYEPTLKPVAAGVEVDEMVLPPPLLAPVVREGARSMEEAQRVWRVVPEASDPKAPARIVGRLVHEALAEWRFPGSGGEESFPKWLTARARATGLVDDRQIRHAVQRSRRLLLRLRRHRLFETLEAADQRLHEVPYSLERDGCVERGTIDLLFRKGGVWTIVEFKTDEVRSHAAFERVLAEKEYGTQACRYAAASGQLLGARPPCLLCMLDDRAGIGLYSVTESGDVEPVELQR